MANIQQAAKWLRKGKTVRRSDWVASFPSWKLDKYDEVVSDGPNPRRGAQQEGKMKQPWKETVLRRFPNAEAKQGQWKVVTNTPYPDALGYGETAELAWQDAAYAVILEERKEKGGGSNN